MKRRVRVLIAAATGHADPDLLQALVVFGGSAQISIDSVFVRDVELVRAATLPFSKEVLPSGTVRELSHQRTTEQLATAAQLLRRHVEELATRMEFPSSFTTSEGFDSAPLAAMAAGVDLVVVARPRWPSSLRPGVKPLPLLEHNKSILFVNEPWSSGNCVIVAYNGASSARALRMASAYAETSELPLIVATPQGRALPELPGSGAVEHLCIDWDEKSLADLCASRDARLLVLENSSTGRWLDVLPMLVHRVACSVLHIAGKPGEP